MSMLMSMLADAAKPVRGKGEGGGGAVIAAHGDTRRWLLEGHM